MYDPHSAGMPSSVFSASSSAQSGSGYSGYSGCSGTLSDVSNPSYADSSSSELPANVVDTDESEPEHLVASTGPSRPKDIPTTSSSDVSFSTAPLPINAMPSYGSVRWSGTEADLSHSLDYQSPMYYDYPVTGSPALHSTSSSGYITPSIDGHKSGLKISTMTAPPTPDECTEMHHGPLDVWTPHYSPTFPTSARMAGTSSVGTSPVASTLGPACGLVGNADLLHQHLTRLHQQRNEDSNAKGKGRAFDPFTYASTSSPGARWS